MIWHQAGGTDEAEVRSKEIRVILTTKSSPSRPSMSAWPNELEHVVYNMT